MAEHPAARAVANGKNARAGCAALLVNCYAAVCIEFNAKRFQTKISGNRLAARYQHPVGLNGLFLVAAFEGAGFARNLDEGVAGNDLHAALAQGLGHALAGILIFVRQNARAGHGKDDLAAKDAQQGGHFNADIGGIGNEHRGRGFRHVQQLVCGKGGLIQAGNFRFCKGAACGDDDALGLNFFARHIHRGGRGHNGHAGDHVHAVVGKQRFHAHADIVGNTLFAGKNSGKIQLAHSEFQAEFASLARLLQQGGGAQPYLAGNAAAHNAGAAHVAAFHQGHLALELRSANGRSIAAGAATYDNYIVHCVLLICAGCCMGAH